MHLILNLLCSIIARLPHGVLSFFAAVMGVLCFDILRIRRGVVLKNLEIAYPQLTSSERVRMGRESTYHFFLTVWELLASETYFKKVDVTLTNESFLRDVLAEGRGAFVMCIHFGNWELLCHEGTKHFAQVSAFVKDVGKGSIASWVNQKRLTNKMIVIERKSPLQTQKKILSVLKSNEIIGFIVDQRRNSEPLVPFFGKPSHTNTSLAQLAIRTKSRVVPCVLVRRGEYKHELVFFPEIDLSKDSGLDDAAHIFNVTWQMNRVAEKMIALAPEQYFWMHDRWKNKSGD